ncbi:MAG TPA: hypothetical protein V6C52_00570 [Coleofasciculaceae cyanobacterium]|jgi:hypothetical protein
MNMAPAGTGTLVDQNLSKAKVTYDLRPPAHAMNHEQQEPDAHTQPLTDMVDRYVRETPVFQEMSIPGQHQVVHFARPVSFYHNPNWEKGIVATVTTKQSFLFPPKLLEKQEQAAFQPIQHYLEAIHQAGRQAMRQQERNGSFQVFA